MTFQVLDFKKDCIGYYEDGKIHSTKLLPSSGATWDYSSNLVGVDYQIARIHSQGASLTDVCPASMKEDWASILQELKSFLKSFKFAKVSLNDNCLYDLLPEYFLFRFLKAKDQITEHVLLKTEKPENYDHMIRLVSMVAEIRSQSVKVSVDPIKHLLSSVAGKNFHKMLQTSTHLVDYNPWGTITGRLTNKPGTLPVLTMNRDYRPCIQPTNDWFVELDYNAAELRVLLALSGEDQPEEDIHDWNVSRVFQDKITRDEAKVKTFAWLYSQRKNKGLEEIYDKDGIVEKYWDGADVKTDFKRVMKDVDRKHALNYIVQSTTADVVFEQAYKIYEFLKEKKSFISVLLHDAVYIDLADSERHDLIKLIDTFKKTRYGSMRVNTAAGKDFGSLKRMKL